VVGLQGREKRLVISISFDTIPACEGQTRDDSSSRAYTWHRAVNKTLAYLLRSQTSVRPFTAVIPLVAWVADSKGVQCVKMMHQQSAESLF